MNTEEYNKWLCKTFPWLIPRNIWTDQVIENLNYEWTQLDQMPEGWRKAFGERMCFEIEALLKEANYDLNYRIWEIKEKWGCLRWYDNSVPDLIQTRLNEVIKKYENLSEETCIECGAPATRISTGWISPYCDGCIKKLNLNSISIEEWREKND